MGANGASGGYNLENSLRFRSSASAYLSRTPTTAGNRKTFTLSCWVKLSTPDTSMSILSSGTSNADRDSLGFSLSRMNTVIIQTAAANPQETTTARFRDPSGWYHAVWSIDTTQAIDSNRIKMYINNELQTNYDTTNYPVLNQEFFINSTAEHRIGKLYYSTDLQQLDGYLTEVNLVDGQALTASDFGDYNSDTGLWQPKKYEGTYGTNGFYLKGRGTDNSGNGNNFTETNFNTTNSALTTYDIMTDVPTLTDEDTANYAVINPLDLSIYTANSTLDGNLSFKNTTTNANGCGRATIGVSSGKWYWETTVTALGGVYPDLGILGSTQPFSDNTQTYIAGYSTGYAYRGSGDKGNNASVVAYGAAYTTGDVIGTALDLDAGTITFYKNNVSQGVAYTGLSGQFSPAWANYSSGVFTANFGQRPFAYTPPTGFKKLNTFNLPDSSIVDGSEYFNTVVYLGDGLSTKTIDTYEFSPDLVWVKNRGSTYNHILVDSVRGANHFLKSNETASEGTTPGNQFLSNGFEFESASVAWNQIGVSHVMWGWRGSDSTAVSNTDGTITSQVSANPTAGFSVVTFTGNSLAGATVGHGLGVAPKMVILKNLAVDNWIVHNNNLPAGQVLLLNGTNAAFTSATSITTSATTLNLTNSSAYYATGKDFVSYVFAEVEGFSKFGSYTGNGSTDGTFVYTGFRPAFVMIKRTDGVANWVVLDATRDSYNVGGLELFPNTSGAENNNSPEIDFLSNGVKLRWTYSGTNASGGTYIYMAFAENPFKNSLAR